MHNLTLITWIIPVFGIITCLPLLIAQLVILIDPGGQKAKDILIGKGEEWRDNTHFKSAYALAWVDWLIFMPVFVLAIKIGLQESRMQKEYRIYEHAIAVADSYIGWIYGVTAVGLFLNASWAYKLTWIPGAVFLYHSISYWFWTSNRNKDGHQLESNAIRIGWTVMNLLTGIFSLLFAWHAT